MVEWKVMPNSRGHVQTATINGVRCAIILATPSLTGGNNQWLVVVGSSVVRWGSDKGRGAKRIKNLGKAKEEAERVALSKPPPVDPA